MVWDRFLVANFRSLPGSVTRPAQFDQMVCRELLWKSVFLPRKKLSGADCDGAARRVASFQKRNGCGQESSGQLNRA